MGRRIIKHPLYSIVYGVFVVLIIIPIVSTIVSAFFTSNVLHNIALLDITTFTLLGKSIAISSLVAFFSTVLGTLFAFLLYKTRILYRNIFKISIVIPLFISPYILAVAWKDFFFLFFNNTYFLSSYTGVVMVMTTIFTPLSMLIVGSALSNISATFEESGLIMHHALKVIIKITLPIIKPALISSFILVFIFSISDFSVPAFLGVKVYATEIFTQFSAFYNHSLAILQSSLLIVICIALLMLEQKYIANAPFFSISNKGTQSYLYSVSKYKVPIYTLLLLWIFLSIFIPILTLVTQSFIHGTSSFFQAFKWLLPTFKDSLFLAFFGAVVVVVTGFSASYLRIRRKNNKSFHSLLLIIFAIPSIILGISLIQFYNNEYLNFIYSSYAIVLIAYWGKFSFISTKLIDNAIRQIPIAFDEVGELNGIAFSRRLFKILIPLIAPTLWVVFVISFVFCLGELTTSIMLYPPGIELMPIKVFTIMANAPQSLVSSLALIVLMVTFFSIITFSILIKALQKKRI